MSKERAPKLLSAGLAVVGGVVIGRLMSEERARNQRKAQLLRELHEQSTQDPLTHLYNRRAFVEAGEALRKTLHHPNQRSGDTGPEKETRHSLLVLDLDHFKKINDGEGGHAKGDAVLCTVADILMRSSRDRDVVARIGGEEMAVLLPRATEQDAVSIAEVIRTQIEQTKQVTVSIGVAELNLHDPSFLETGLKAADLALYAAKDQGRNQVIASSSLPPRELVAQA